MQTLIKPAEVVNTGVYRPAPTTARFDVNVLAPHVLSAEERFVIPILGKDLYYDLVLKQNPLESNYNPAVGAIVNKFIAPAPAAYEDLWISYLMRYIAYAVYYEVLPFIAVQVSSKGIYQNDSEFAQNSGVSGVRFLQDNMMQKIDNLKPLLEEYLCKNKSNFILFDSRNCPCDDECNSCNCGYHIKTGKHCHNCEVGKNSSTNIIFY
jgi:hypothetical protein